jgi:hypothetical protein
MQGDRYYLSLWSGMGALRLATNFSRMLIDIECWATDYIVPISPVGGYVGETFDAKGEHNLRILLIPYNPRTEDSLHPRTGEGRRK